MSEHNHPIEGSRAWFFFEFSPLLLFGGLFMLMMAIPLVLTGILATQGLIIGASILTSLLLVLTIPRVLPFFLLAMAVLYFGAPGALQVGGSIALCFIAFVIIGMVWLPLKKTRTKV
jgi:formate hydrogenlyase subunit 4